MKKLVHFLLLNIDGLLGKVTVLVEVGDHVVKRAGALVFAGLFLFRFFLALLALAVFHFPLVEGFFRFCHSEFLVI